MKVTQLANYIEQEQSRGVDIRLSDAQAEKIVSILRAANRSSDFKLKPIGAPGSVARMLQDYPEEVVNAFIAGISSDDEALGQMFEIINLLDKAGYEIVRKARLETSNWRHGT